MAGPAPKTKMVHPRGSPIFKNYWSNGCICRNLCYKFLLPGKVTRL
jgi:hypothetical protein